MKNGGIIGPKNTTSLSKASGIFSIKEVYGAKKNNTWPGGIVLSGLQLYLDAGSPTSYPGSGTVWFDISGNGRNATLNNVSYSSNNGGIFAITSAANSNIDITTYNIASSDYTVMTATRYSGATRGRILNGRSNNWLMGHWGSNTLNYFAEGWVSAVNNGPNDTNWRIYSATGRGTYQLRANNSLVVSGTSGTQGPNGLVAGYSGIGGTSSETSDAEIGFVLVYNRILTDAELSQNYESFRSRYGV
jgi:hypothetical protein